MKKYHIKPQNVLGHSDIAPTRKPTPEYAFHGDIWQGDGVGVWYNLRNADKVTEVDEQKMLAAIGYDVANLTAAKWAFCRHWLPEVVPIDNDVMHLLNNPYNQRFDAEKQSFPRR